VHFGTDEPQTGRVYYRVFSGGKWKYSFLFSNVIEMTYKPEYKSHCNLICDSWKILEASVGVCKPCGVESAAEVSSFVPLTFGGSRQKIVQPGEFFTTDPVELSPEKGEDLCIQIRYQGNMVPYHLESIVPTFVEKDGVFVPDKKVPVPGMVACDRPVKAKIGYLGDSITQGIGTPPGAYTYWCARVSEAIGEDYSYWNLGIGYGRGQDAATDGAWLYKARKMDAVVVTFGSNDVGRGRTVEQMKADFTLIVDRLKDAGIPVFLQTLPPFNWKEEYLARWNEINAFLVNELSFRADGFLDVAPLLTVEGEEGMAKYGKHPDEEGCRIWAEALLPRFREFLKKI